MNWRRPGGLSRAVCLPALAALLAGFSGSVPAVAQTPVPEMRATATPVPRPPTIDGVLDEPFWAMIEPVTDFRQRDPVDGAPGSEPTEVRIGYDANALYFGFVFHDSEPALIRRSILHRGGRIDKDDRVIVALDTYHDRRNAYIFEVGALGTQDDALISDESMTLDDWNWDGVFTSETRVTEDGWVLELEIPFTTIRFPDVDEPTMGIAFMRSIRRKNESVFWPHIGQEYRSGISQVSRYATLDGLSGLRRGRYAEVKPFATAGTQRMAGDASFEGQTDIGVDVKYALTSNLTFDLTWNTDFAQVESDNVQINLTRFDLFYPEKREFFLERAGLFQFGTPRQTEVFFSRRVGLRGDIVGGGRLTGQAGPLSIGALALRTRGYSDDAVALPAAWNSVVRLRTDLRPRTTLGGIITSLDHENGWDRSAGLDFSSRFWSSSAFNVWAARVWNPDLFPYATGAAGSTGGSVSPGSADPREAGSANATSAELVLQNDRYAFIVSRLLIDESFAPALGFVPRTDQDRWGGYVAFTPRFESSAWARQLSLEVKGDHVRSREGAKQTHVLGTGARLTLESGEFANIGFSERFERLELPAHIRGRRLATGDYRFRRFTAAMRSNDSRTFSGGLQGSIGDFWSGTRTEIGGGATWITGPHLTIGGRYAWNGVSLPVEDGDFSTHLVSANIQGAVSRKLFANALVQWDNHSRELQANIRIDWIHTPGSDLFVVIDTGYLTGDLLDPRAPRWQRRTGVVKLTYLMAF
ncbi:MAG: carbohydrate binding family 9 domain-containing protein [Gammaproteobacteria bacterium]|nr:carbohydrate binding family 9 domain-containing protein [Gammaproteobacteria bacterium]